MDELSFAECKSFADSLEENRPDYIDGMVLGAFHLRSAIIVNPKEGSSKEDSTAKLSFWCTCCGAAVDCDLSTAFWPGAREVSSLCRLSVRDVKKFMLEEQDNEELAPEARKDDAASWYNVYMYLVHHVLRRSHCWNLESYGHVMVSTMGIVPGRANRWMSKGECSAGCYASIGDHRVPLRAPDGCCAAIPTLNNIVSMVGDLRGPAMLLARSLCDGRVRFVESRKGATRPSPSRTRML